MGASAQVPASNPIQLGDANIVALRCLGGLAVTSGTRLQADVPGPVFITRLRPVTYRFDQARLSEFQRTGTLPGGSAP